MVRGVRGNETYIWSRGCRHQYGWGASCVQLATEELLGYQSRPIGRVGVVRRLDHRQNVDGQVGAQHIRHDTRDEDHYGDIEADGNVACIESFRINRSR